MRLLGSVDSAVWPLEVTGEDLPAKELKLLLLEDYLEELLQMAFASLPSSSPLALPQGLSVCMMEILLSYCWNYDYLKDDL